MKKYIFCDPKRKVHIKVCVSADRALREMSGALSLQSVVSVPLITPLDQKTLQVSTVSGVPALGKRRGELTSLLLHYFSDIARLDLKANTSSYSIFTELQSLFSAFSSHGVIVKAIAEIEQECLRLPLVPIHGDLQVQNIFLSASGLGLIDFEHSMIAPIELELCNSLFFSDKNCLDVETLIPELIQRKLAKATNFYTMLIFYALKQAATERSLSEAAVRFERGVTRLNSITKSNFNSLLFPPLKKPQRSTVPSSHYRSCFS